MSDANQIPNCPRCTIWRYTRSRRRGLLDKFMAAIGFTPMRCPKCYRRVYIRTSIVVPDAEAAN